MSITSKANTESRFVWIEQENGSKDLSVEHAVLMYRNFQGRETMYNPNGGKRTFNLVLSDEVAEELRELGWNVKEKPPKDGYEDTLYTTEIIVNTKSKFPPKLYLCSDWNGRKRMVEIGEESFKDLDELSYSNIDLIIHPYNHNKSEKYQVKGYLKQLYATQAVSMDFGGKYANYEVAGDPGSPTEDDDDANLPF